MKLLINFEALILIDKFYSFQRLSCEDSIVNILKKGGNMKLIKIGGILALVGLVIFLILNYAPKPYAGSSGAGMAGLPAAFAMMAALGLFVTGLLIVGIGLFLHFR